jgi:hypothetical protein
MINTIKIHLLPNFEEAIKFGYLNKLSSKLGVKKFIIRFVVLTNVGLLIMKILEKIQKILFL